MGRNYEPFDYVITKSGDVRIFRGGREVVTVRGRAASALGAILGRGEESPIRRLSNGSPATTSVAMNVANWR